MLLVSAVTIKVGCTVPEGVVPEGAGCSDSKGGVKLHYVATNELVADVLTKPLSRVKFEYFRDKLGMVPR